MEHLTIEEITKAVQGKVIVRGNRFDYNQVSTDTRKIDAKSIFVALKGESFNGNNYINQASEKGAFLCIVDELNFNTCDLKEHTSIIKVLNTHKALLDLARIYRKKLNIKVVAITGSTGKTSTKDLTAAVLGAKYKVFKTEGNFNNEIGLPLMIFKLDNSYDIAVLEMGMNNLGEISRMTKVAKPDVALITNVGITHIENLKTRENILKAKLEVTDFFNKDNTLIINGDNDMLNLIENKNYNIMRTGLNKSMDIYAQNVKLNERSVDFQVLSDKEICEFHLDVPGEHNVSNALLAIACGRKFKLTLQEMNEGLGNVQTTSMRLDIIKGSKATIINDCYNASPDSMKSAIDVLSNIKGNKKIAVLGTMKELGHMAYESHKQVGEYARNKGIDIIITLGEFTKAYDEGFQGVINFKNMDEVLEFLRLNIKDKDIILFKASRSMKFEMMVEKLKIYIF